MREQEVLLPPSTFQVFDQAAASLLEVGIIGALLLISLAANAYLVWSLIRCYRGSRRDFGGGYDA